MSQPQLTQQQIEELLAEHPYGWQDENGVDLTLIAENLTMTPDQRVRRAQITAQRLARMFDGRGA